MGATEKTSLTVAQVIALYLDDVTMRLSLRQIVESNKSRAEYYLRSFVATYGAQNMTDCRKSDLTRWLIDHPEWRSEHTKNDAISLVIRCFRWAEDDGCIPYTPYRRPRNLRLRLRPRMACTPADYAALMNSARRERSAHCLPSARAFRVAVYVLWRTGMRTCELRAALWSQVDWQAGVIRLADHKTAATSGEDRVIGLDDRVMRLLHFLYRYRRPGQEHVFVNGWGNPWEKDVMDKRFRDYARRAGIDEKKSLYSLRHGFCTEALQRGVGERMVADQMGHASTKFIAWYGRTTRQRADHLRNVANLANGMPARPLPPAPTPPAEEAASSAQAIGPKLPVKAWAAHRAACWARERNPALKSDRQVWDWLQGRAECPQKFRMPRETFLAYVSLVRTKLKRYREAGAAGDSESTNGKDDAG